MELRHLRYFITVAEEGHITGAAERLGMQQPPLSRLIKAMERELDAQLFVRKPRGVELTDAGRAFHDKARAVLEDLDHAFETTRSTARGERGRIRLGVTPTSPFHPFVPRVIRTFREAFPLVSLTLEEHLSLQLIEHLRIGRIDAAFLWTPPAEGLVINPLLEDALVVALPSGHALAQSDGRGDAAISLKTLADETFIIYGRRDGFGLYAATIVACNAAGFSPRFGQEAPRLASALNLVAIGLGVFFVPGSIQRVHMDGVVYRRLKGRHRPKASLNLASRRGDHSAVVRHFLNVVKKAAKDLPLDRSTKSSCD